LTFYIETNVYQTKTYKFSTKLATQVYVLLHSKSRSCDITLKANHQVDKLK